MHLTSAFDNDFNEFWSAYPSRVGKLAARKAFEKVRRDGTSLAALLEGIRRYVQTKPAYADFCHPTTWLNQGRWMDEAPTAARANYEWTCPHEPKCLGRHACQVKQTIAAGKVKAS